MKIKTPTKIEDKKTWFLKYPKLSGTMFTYDISARTTDIIIGRRRMGSDEIDLRYFPAWKVIGYTLNPPFEARGYDSVAIMFEHENGDRSWNHFLASDDA